MKLKPVDLKTIKLDQVPAPAVVPQEQRTGFQQFVESNPVASGLVGLGGGLVKGATGVIQTAAQLAGADELAQRAGAVTQDINRDIDRLGTAGAVGGFVGEVAPYVALPAGAATLAGRVGLGAAGGALAGGMQAQETPDLAQRASDALTGAAVGAVIPVGLAGAGKALQAAAPTIDQEVAKLASKAKEFGIPLTMTQVAPSRVRNTLQKVTQEVPFSGTQSFRENQLSAWNKAVAKTLGVDAERLTPDAVNTFLDNTEKGFANALKGKTVTATADDVAAIRSIVAEAKDTVGGDALRVIEANAKKAIGELGGGTVDGQKIANFRSSLIKRIPRMEAGAKQYVGELVEKIDEVTERSVGPEAAKQLQGLRRQWRNFRTLEPLLEKSGDQPISPAALMQRVAASPFIKAARKSVGEDDLVDLAKIGKMIPELGGSDTFQKSALGAAGVGALVEPTTLAISGGVVGSARAYQSLYNQSQRLVDAAVKRSLPGAKPTMLQRVSQALIGGTADDVVRAAGSKEQAVKTVRAIAAKGDDATRAEANQLVEEINRGGVSRANPSLPRSAEEEYFANSRPLTMDEIEEIGRVTNQSDIQMSRGIEYAKALGVDPLQISRQIERSLKLDTKSMPKRGEALSTWIMRNYGGINDTAMRAEFVDKIPFVMRRGGKADMSIAAQGAFDAGYISAPNEDLLVNALKNNRVYSAADEGAMARDVAQEQLGQTEKYYADLLDIDLSGGARAVRQKVVNRIAELGNRVAQGDRNAALTIEQLSGITPLTRNSQRGSLNSPNAPLALTGTGAAALGAGMYLNNLRPVDLKSIQLDKEPMPIVAPQPVSNTFIIQEEGFRPTAYKDSVGVTTIGYGFNLEQPNASDIIKRVKIPETYEGLRSGREQLSEASARKLFDYKHRKSESAAAALVPNYSQLGENQRAALTSMAYHMGGAGLRKFKKTLAYLREGNAKAVENQLLSSEMARQTPARAKRTALMLAYNLSPQEAEKRLLEQGRISPQERQFVEPVAQVAPRQRVRYNDAKKMVGLGDA